MDVSMLKQFWTVFTVTLASFGNMSLQETILFLSDFQRKPQQVWPISLSNVFWAENVTHVNGCFNVKAILDNCQSCFGFLGQHVPTRNNPLCVTFPKEPKASLTSIAVACVLSWKCHPCKWIFKRFCCSCREKKSDQWVEFFHFFFSPWTSAIKIFFSQ
jgi:hypothetical protein